MNLKAIKLFYWITFTLSIIILMLNIGLGLIAFGIILLPVLFIHFIIGLNLKKIENYKIPIIFSALNLLIFALVRPDGVHNLSDTGLSASLNLFGINAGYDRNYESLIFYASLFLLFIQIIIDLRLRNLKKQSNKKFIP